MNSEQKWKRYYAENSLAVLKNIQDPQGFCIGFDKEYLDYVELGDHYQARNLLEVVCLSLLQFTYRVKIYGSETATETMEDKILRLIQNETMNPSSEASIIVSIIRAFPN